MSWLLNYIFKFAYKGTCSYCGKQDVDIHSLSTIPSKEKDSVSAGCCNDCCKQCYKCGILYYAKNTTDNLCYDCHEKLEKEDILLRYRENFYEECPNPQSRDILNLAGQGNVFLTEQEYVDIFTYYNWRHSYGGKRWVDITKTLFKLIRLQSNFNIRESQLVIDHAFDLIHNTDSIFSKAPEDVQQWIMSALEIKKHASPFYYMDKCSNDVQKLLKKYYHNDISEFSSLERFTNKEKTISIDNMINRFFDTKMKDEAESILKNLGINSDTINLIFRILKYNSYENVIKNIIYIDLNINRIDNLIELFKIPFKDLSLTTKNMLLFLSKHVDSQALDRVIHYFSNNPSTYANKWISILKDKTQMNWLKVLNKNSSLNKIAISQTVFFDFYALNYIDCNNLNKEKSMCKFVKEYTNKQIIDYLANLLKVLVVGEAAHVKDVFASGYYL